MEMDVVARFIASITYNRQGTGTYDSEDGVTLFQDEVEESVEDDHETRLAVEVTFKDSDPVSFRVVKVSFEGENTIKGSNRKRILRSSPVRDCADLIAPSEECAPRPAQRASVNDRSRRSLLCRHRRDCRSVD